MRGTGETNTTGFSSLFSRTWRRFLGTFLSTLFLVAAVVFLARLLGSEGGRLLWQLLLDAQPALLALAAGVNLGRYALWAARWQWVLRPVARVSWWAATRSLMASVFLNTLVPAARPVGGLVRARILSRLAGLPSGPIYGGALIDQFGYSLVSLLLGALCLPWAFLPETAPRSHRRPLLLGALLIILFGTLLLSRRKTRHQLAGWMRRRLPHAADTVKGAVEAARILLGRGTTFLFLALGSATVWFANAIVLWIAGKATGADFSLAAAAAAWALGSLAGAVTGTPGGAGTTEAAAMLPLTTQGVPSAEALAAILVARGLHYGSAILIGGLCFLSRPASFRGSERVPLLRPPGS
ncbi:MAG: YbhN family protein [Acidobacteriota bacterium]